jgi:phosphomevalonate kinase
MISGLSAFEHNNPSTFYPLMDELKNISLQACGHYRLKKSALFLDSINQYFARLKKIGEQAQIGIISPDHLEIAEIAASYGAAYKPSGAGGGDIGTAFFLDTKSAERFLENMEAKKYPVIDLVTDVPGTGMEK